MRMSNSIDLQYKAVVVLWTDLLPAQSATKDDDRRLLYVAITRSEQNLVLMGKGNQGFNAELSEACRVMICEEVDGRSGME